MRLRNKGIERYRFPNRQGPPDSVTGLTIDITLSVVLLLTMPTNHYPKLYGFEFAMGDLNYLDYGATWTRQISETCFHFISLINWEDAVGEREAAEIGQTYNLSLAEVDLALISAEKITRALEFCGQQSEQAPLWRAYACLEYGIKAPLEDENTNNYRRTFQRFTRRSRELQTQPSLHQAAMAKPVNRIGSTALEFMQGDMDSALNRMEECPTKSILLKMQGKR